MDKHVVMFYPYISEEAIERAVSVLRSRWIGEGDVVKEFEAALCERFGFYHALALCNGTAGLRLALAVAGVGPGDEVITSSMTCTATNTPILEQYATPVFADIQWETGNIDPEDIEHRITDRTAAIMVVHWGGYPCDMDEILAIADRYALPVIEDGAHALGASYHGQPIGTVSDFTMFSFQAIKQLTTVDGGLLATRSQVMHDRARIRRWFGIDRDNRVPSEVWPGYKAWPQTQVGYKYHMNNVTAAIGLGNLEHIEDILYRRHAIVARYREALHDVPGVTLFERLDDRTSGDWLFTMHVENRMDFHRALLERGVESSVCHIRNDLHPMFGPLRHDLYALDLYQSTYISIPLHDHLTDEDVEHVISAIQKGW
jgi:perosamine synthetase